MRTNFVPHGSQLFKVNIGCQPVYFLCCFNTSFSRLEHNDQPIDKS